MSLSACIMAHPKRAHFVDELRERVGEIPVIWDRDDDRWDTGRRAMLAYDPKASHHLVLQDDAMPSRNLLQAAGKAVEAAGEHPVSLYIGDVRPSQHLVMPAVKYARERNSPWLILEGPWWGVGIVMPTAHIEEMARWGERHHHIVNYDKRITKWYLREAKLQCWYTVPSLVDHRPVDENPSLVAGRTGDRRAQWFIGEERSGLEIDWTLPPTDLKCTFRNKRNGRLVRVHIGGKNWRRMHNTRIWEQVEE